MRRMQAFASRDIGVAALPLQSQYEALHAHRSGCCMVAQHDRWLIIAINLSYDNAEAKQHRTKFKTVF